MLLKMLQIFLHFGPLIVGVLLGGHFGPLSFYDGGCLIHVVGEIVGRHGVMIAIVFLAQLLCRTAATWSLVFASF